MKRSALLPVLAASVLLAGATPAIAAASSAPGSDTADTADTAAAGTAQASAPAAATIPVDNADSFGRLTAGAVNARGMTLMGDATIRLSGPNRYATAVAISEFEWGETQTEAVYLATAEGYADALAMGPSTLGFGPLLLTTRNALPAETEAEIARLKPCFIVVAGGPNAVSDAVALAADRYTNPNACP